MATPQELWLYVDATTGQQKGPLPAAMLKRLLRRGLVQPQQFVWTQRLSEWQALAQVDAFATYCATWSSFWYYMVEDLDAVATDATSSSSSSTKQAGPVSTQALIALFLDGDIDGMTLVWTTTMATWQPIGDVPALKEFLHDANEDQAREEEVLATQRAVAVADQIYADDAKVEAFQADDGQQYVFDAATNTWCTPADKIEDELDALREAAGETKADFDAAQARKQNKKQQPQAHLTGTNLADTHLTEANPSHPNLTTNDDATLKRKKKPKKKKSERWHASKHKTWVYVNGLPLDVTLDEVHAHFSKCGVIQTDVVTSAPRIKLYPNKAFGGLNGDASVCFMKEASVELAVQLLDKSQIRPEWPIDVSPAVFEQKGRDFVKRKRVKLDSRAKVKKFEQEKALSWNEGADEDRMGLRIVVLKHLFTPAEVADDADAAELQADILTECLKMGDVAKITLFPKHVDGIVVVKFESTGAAATCVDVMHDRFFAGRRVACSFWDGTDYTYRESKDEAQERAEQFSEWLEQGSSSSEEEEGDEDEEESASATIGSAAGRGSEAATIHTDRVLPALEEENSESDDSDNDDDAVAATAMVHAGRVMPDLDDEEEDEENED